MRNPVMMNPDDKAGNCRGSGVIALSGRRAKSVVERVRIRLDIGAERSARSASASPCLQCPPSSRSARPRRPDAAPLRGRNQEIICNQRPSEGAPRLAAEHPATTHSHRSSRREGGRYEGGACSDNTAAGSANNVAAAKTAAPNHCSTRPVARIGGREVVKHDVLALHRLILLPPPPSILPSFHLLPRGRLVMPWGLRRRHEGRGDGRAEGKRNDARIDLESHRATPTVVACATFTSPLTRSVATASGNNGCEKRLSSRR